MRQTYRPTEVRPGDIVFHSGRGTVSSAIRWAQGVPYSHVSLVTSRADSLGVFDILDVVSERRTVPIFLRAEHDDHWAVYRPAWPGTNADVDQELGKQVAHLALLAHDRHPVEYPTSKLAAYIGWVPRRMAAWLLQRQEQHVCSATVAIAWERVGFPWPKPGAEMDVALMWKQAQTWTRITDHNHYAAFNATQHAIAAIRKAGAR